MKNWQKLALTCLAALLSGASLTLAFAPFEIYPLAILAPAALLALWLNTSAKKAFSLGFLFGLGFFGTGVYWVFISIHDYGHAPALLAGALTVGLVSLLALFPGFAGYLTSRYFPKTNTPKLIYAFPTIWVTTEWLRGWVATGFPWLLVGYSQTSSPLSGYAPLLSVYGVSLAVTLTSGLLLNAILQFRKQHYRATYLNLFAIVCLFTLGGLSSLIPWTEPTGKPLAVSLVQGNIPQSIKWSPDYADLSLNRYETLTAPLWGKSQLIVWPEAAIPVPLQDVKPYINALNQKAVKTDSHLLLGIPIPDANTHRYYNAIVSLGNTPGRYLKQHLVPFGEYTPFQQLSSRLFHFLDIPMSEMAAGQSQQPLLAANQVYILPFICYEIAYTALAQTNNPNVGLLLTVTNDAWFGNSSAQAQHLQIAQMRAIELRRPLLFASNNGLTAAIGPKGTIEAAAPAHVTFVLNAAVQPMTGMTPFMRNGLDPLAFIFICLIVIARRARLTTPDFIKPD